MNANIPKPPKTFGQLSQASKNSINQYFADQLTREKNEISHIVQRMMCKYFICACHDSGASNDDIIAYLGNLRRYKRKLNSLKSNAEMEKYLDDYILTFMEEIPDYFLKGLIEE